MKHKNQKHLLEIYKWRVITNAESLCDKFMSKVEKGKARSVETYSECKRLKQYIDELRLLKRELESKKIKCHTCNDYGNIIYGRYPEKLKPCPDCSNK